MKNLNFFLLLITLFFGACSQGAKTPAEFAVTIAGLAAPAGGMVVTGKKNGGESFSRVMNDDKVSLELSNGSWNFLVVSWEGATPFDGRIRCAFKKNIQLDGTSVALNFALATDECGRPELAINGSWNTTLTVDEFYPPEIHLCRSASALATFPATCAFSATTSDPYAAALGSLQLSIPNTLQAPSGSIQELSAGLVHTCLAIAPTVSGAPKLPAFQADFYFPVRFRGFFQSGCSGKSIDAYMNNGTVAHQPTGALNKFYAHYSDERVCAVANAGTPVDKLDDIGLGASGKPFGICNLAQLKDWQNNIASGTNYITAPVYLMRDLDLIEGVNFRSVTPNAFASCSGDGSTFVPIGISAADCHSITATFTGAFHGLGHTLKNVRFKPGNVAVDNVGLFSLLGGEVAYLNLAGSDFEGDDYAGSVAGSLAASGNVHHVSVTNARIETKQSFAGGIVGSSNTTGVLTHLSVERSRVRGHSNLGGIVGLAAGAIEHARFSGAVTSDEFTSANYFGGIVGQGTTVARSVSSGLVVGPRKVGGIAGHLGGGANFVRSLATVISPATGSAVYLGGLVGSGAGATNSFFSGHLRNSCAAADLNCNVGGIAGVNAVTNTKTWSSVALAASLGGRDAAISGLNTDVYGNITADDICPAGSCSNPSTEWNFFAGGLPRLAFENHDCQISTYQQSLALQTTTGGLGSAKAPAKICTYAQLQELNNSFPGKSFELADDIVLKQEELYAVQTLESVLDGKGHFLIAGGNGAGTFNIIETIEEDAQVKNIHLLGQTGGNGTDDEFAALAKLNRGLISNVQVSFAKFAGPDIAGLVSKNDSSGVIRDVRVHADLSGQERMGGIAMLNDGVIERAKFEGHISYPASFSAVSSDPVGGIVAENNNLIKHAAFSGRMELDGNGSAAVSGGAGGIVGSNEGVIQDALVEAESSIFYSSQAANIIGGLVGEMLSGSQLSRGVSLGAVLHGGNISPISTVSGLVGSSAGSVSASYFNVPSLENPTGGPSSFSPVAGTCTASGSASNGTYYLRSDSISGFVRVVVTGGTSFTYQNPDGASCVSSPSYYYQNLNGESILPFPHPVVNSALFLALKSAGGGGYSILVDGAVDELKILNSYKDYLTAGNLTPRSTWLWEDGKPRLFFLND